MRLCRDVVAVVQNPPGQRAADRLARGERGPVERLDRRLGRREGPSIRATSQGMSAGSGAICRSGKELQEKVGEQCIVGRSEGGDTAGLHPAREIGQADPPPRRGGIRAVREKVGARRDWQKVDEMERGRFRPLSGRPSQSSATSASAPPSRAMSARARPAAATISAPVAAAQTWARWVLPDPSGPTGASAARSASPPGRSMAATASAVGRRDEEIAACMGRPGRQVEGELAFHLRRRRSRAPLRNGRRGPGRAGSGGIA